MAAAILPIIAAVAPSLIDLIVGLVHRGAPVVEAQNGPKTGPVKFAQLLETVMAQLNTAAMAGQIGKDIPNVDTVKIVIQAVVTAMQLSGMLGASITPVPVSTQTISLKAGQTVTISAA